jgi:hypothetical protein
LIIDEYRVEEPLQDPRTMLVVPTLPLFQSTAVPFGFEV